MTQALDELFDLILLVAFLNQIQKFLILVRLEQPLEEPQEELIHRLEQELDVYWLEAAK